MILTLEKLEKDLEALSKLLKEDPSKLWEKAILGEAKGGDDGQVVKFEVALASLPMNEYGQKIYSNAMTYGGKNKDVDMQKVDSYLPKVYQKLRSGTPYEFFERLANFMNDPSGTVGDMMIPASETGTGEPEKMNIAQQLGFSFSALLAYKILLETFVNIEASPAGKILEFITAGLTGGYVESDTEIADFVGGDGVDYSLKFLKPNSKYEGSLISLYRAIHAGNSDDENSDDENSDDEYNRVVYLTMSKTLNGKVVNFDQVSLDDLRKSKIGISFVFFEIDPGKIEQLIFTDRSKLQDILKSIYTQSPGEFSQGGKHHDAYKKIMGTTSKNAFKKVLAGLGVGASTEKQISSQDMVHSLEMLRNINDLGEVVEKLKTVDIKGGEIEIPIPKEIKTYLRDLRNSVNVVNDPDPKSYVVEPKSGKYSDAKKKEKRIRNALRKQSEEIKGTKAFQEIEKGLENAEEIVKKLGNKMNVSQAIVAYFIPKGADLENHNETYLAALRRATREGDGGPFAMGEKENLLINPEPKEVEERIKLIQKQRVLGPVSSEEITLIHRLFHILRRFKQQKSPLEFNPRFEESFSELPEKPSEFENYVRDKILSDPAIKGAIKKKVIVQGDDGYTAGEDDGAHSKVITANLKVERDSFFKKYCKQTPDMPIIRMEFSAEKFVNTFENFRKDHDVYNRLIIDAVRNICTNLTDFNKNFRESLTEGLTYDSLDPALESLAGLTQNWNTMTKTRARQEIKKNKEKG